MKTRILIKKKMSDFLKKRIKKSEEDIDNGNYKTFSSVDELINHIKNMPNPWYRRIFNRIRWFSENWLYPTTWYRCFNKYYIWFKWGFNPEELWNLDVSLSKLIILRLKKFKENFRGIPPLIFEDEQLIEDYEAIHGKFESDDKDEYGIALWTFVLDEMIKGFQLTIDDDWNASGSYENHFNEIKNSLQYFVKYFNNLWD